MSAALLELEALRITHDGAVRATPDGVTFSIDRGEAVLLLGPSGCGKSTLALAAAGLVPRAIDATLEGTVRLSGVDATTLPPGHAATRVAMVFQDPDAQLVTSTVEDEVAFGIENLCMDEAEIERRVTDALQAVGLADRRHDAPEVLSGGGRQRLAIAAALALHAPLIVLDEPTANLDPAGASEVYDALAPLVRSGSHGVLLVEHNLDEALRIATRVIALNHAGRVIADGPPREVLAGYADEIAAAGIWLPIGVAASRALARVGAPLPGTPLTASELVAAIDTQPVPEVVAHARTGAIHTIEVPDARAGDPKPSDDPLISVHDLSVRAGSRTILDHVSLRIRRGAFTAIVGPNGAGKSTLLSAIGGVTRPPKRTVTLDGADVARLSPRQLRARVGVVFQNPEHQFLRQRVRDELELGLDPSDPQVRGRIDDLLHRFGLVQHEHVHPYLLSGGGKRRLSVGTALVDQAPLLVLDEPTYGQDRARAEELLDLLEELRRGGTTIVMATHDLQLVVEHATEIVVLDQGRVIDHGPVSRVLAGGALVRVGLGLPPLARALRVSRHTALRELMSVHELASLAATAAGPERDR